MCVTPYVGVWIETLVSNEVSYVTKSLLMWECGLKPPCTKLSDRFTSHSLCGSVD